MHVQLAIHLTQTQDVKLSANQLSEHSISYYSLFSQEGYTHIDTRKDKFWGIYFIFSLGKPFYVLNGKQCHRVSAE